ncbi:hypothetical protein DFH06DRAFT_1463885 [Mycena polygramma]|nr:hypothetical protein DFH06DRAFT_1463885 [Mycena polygramma]
MDSTDDLCERTLQGDTTIYDALNTSGAFNPDVLGFGVRLSNFIINVCAGIVIRWGSPEEAHEATQILLLQIGAIVLCTLYSVVGDQLTFFDGQFTLVVVHSPIACPSNLNIWAYIWCFLRYAQDLFKKRRNRPELGFKGVLAFFKWFFTHCQWPLYITVSQSYYYWAFFGMAIDTVEPGYSFTYGQALSVVAAATSVIPVLRLLFNLKPTKDAFLRICRDVRSEVAFLLLGSGSVARSANKRFFKNRLTLPPHEFRWGEDTSLPLAHLSPGTSNASTRIGTPTGPGSQSTSGLVAGVSSIGTTSPVVASASSTPTDSPETPDTPITVPRPDFRLSLTIDVPGPASPSLERDADIFTPMDLPNASTQISPSDPAGVGPTRTPPPLVSSSGASMPITSPETSNTPSVPVHRPDSRSASTVDTPDLASVPVTAVTGQVAQESIAVDGLRPSVDASNSPTENPVGSSSGILVENNVTERKRTPRHRSTY